MAKSSNIGTTPNLSPGRRVGKQRQVLIPQNPFTFETEMIAITGATEQLGGLIFDNLPKTTDADKLVAVGVWETALGCRPTRNCGRPLVPACC
jgi:hypothetical protein